MVPVNVTSGSQGRLPDYIRSTGGSNDANEPSRPEGNTLRALQRRTHQQMSSRAHQVCRRAGVCLRAQVYGLRPATRIGGNAGTTDVRTCVIVRADSKQHVRTFRIQVESYMWMRFSKASQHAPQCRLAPLPASSAAAAIAATRRYGCRVDRPARQRACLGSLACWLAARRLPRPA